MLWKPKNRPWGHRRFSVFHSSSSFFLLPTHSGYLANNDLVYGIRDNNMTCEPPMFLLNYYYDTFL